MDCECVAGCPFFNDRMSANPATAGMYKRKYCQGDYASCARYRVFKARGKPAVPADLYPNQAGKADAILGA